MANNDPNAQSMTVQQVFDLALQHHQAGRLAEAEAVYRQILAQQPNHADALHLLGVVEAQKGRNEAAAELITRAISVNPGQGVYYNNLGNVLKDLGRNNEAIAAYQASLKINTTSAEAYNNLGEALNRQERWQEATAALLSALELKPDYAEAHYNLGNAQGAQGIVYAAIASFQRAIQLRPDLPEPRNNLGNLLKDADRADDAIAVFQELIKLHPNLAEAHGNLANVFRITGRMDEAIGAGRKAIQCEPCPAALHSNLAYYLYFHPSYDARAIQSELEEWNRRFAQPLKKNIQPHTHVREPDRKLRIGYVSGDFFQHACVHFLITLMEHHNHKNFEIFCYSNTRRDDPITARLRTYADAWRDIRNITDEQASEMIRKDQIDILVDLSLHSAEHRLLIFARKPAPVQVTWLGYPGSTGLHTVDYRLTDPYLDPPGLDDAFYSEASVRLPDCFWCYDPLISVPAVHTLPALRNGYVTFGCLNKFAKINDQVLVLWIRILHATKHSRLLILAPEGRMRQEMLKQFERQGIAEERVVFLKNLPRPEYLRLFDRIDLCLDPFPYNGHTTTFDSLWMGVPVVSLSGKTAMGRAGKSILTNVGLPELVAKTPEEYVDIAIKLAGDLPRLAELRKTLRERMENSPLMDAKRFAQNVEAAYRDIWQRWCTEPSRHTARGPNLAP